MLMNQSNKIIKLGDDIIDMSPVPLLMETLPDYETINKRIMEIISAIPDEYKLISKIHEHLDNDKYNDSCKNMIDDKLCITCKGLNVKINNFLNTDEEIINSLKKTIFEKIIKTSNVLHSSNSLSLTLCMSRVQIYHNGDFIGMHDHVKHDQTELNTEDDITYWSGSYYISNGCPDSDKPFSGVLTFHTGHQEFHVKPEAGMLLIWPSDVVHHVNPFFGKSERIMICWNVTAKLI